MSATIPEGWQPNGPHLIRFEPPNLFMTRTRGDVGPQDAERTYTILQEKIDQIGPIYWISNISNMGRLSPEVRKVKGPPGRIHNPKDVLGMAFVCSSFHQRVLVQIATKANRFLRGDNSPVNMEFFSSEEEALAWVDACRAKQAAK